MEVRITFSLGVSVQYRNSEGHQCLINSRHDKLTALQDDSCLAGQAVTNLYSTSVGYRAIHTATFTLVRWITSWELPTYTKQ